MMMWWVCFHTKLIKILIKRCLYQFSSFLSCVWIMWWVNYWSFNEWSRFSIEIQDIVRGIVLFYHFQRRGNIEYHTHAVNLNVATFIFIKYPESDMNSLRHLFSQVFFVQLIIICYWYFPPTDRLFDSFVYFLVIFRWISIFSEQNETFVFSLGDVA